jgi:HprK-related kinase A
LDAGPFRVGFRSAEARFLETVAYFYGDAMRHDGPQVLDFDIRLSRPPGLRRWVRPQIVFRVDGRRPFEAQPLENAFPMYEWGLNWCIATTAHRYLMLHAGSVAFGDHAMILPGMPGSGKSTLSAALHLGGARLLSDEFGLVLPESGAMLAMPRGIPLKNASIEAILEFDPKAPLGPTYPKTRKGRVRHLRPDPASQGRADVPARPRWLVFPHYQAGASEALSPLARHEAFRRLAFNCFNYKLLGETAFRAISTIVHEVDCFSMTFSRLDRATALLRGLADNGRRDVVAEGIGESAV